MTQWIKILYLLLLALMISGLNHCTVKDCYACTLSSECNNSCYLVKGTDYSGHQVNENVCGLDANTASVCLNIDKAFSFRIVKLP